MIFRDLVIICALLFSFHNSVTAQQNDVLKNYFKCDTHATVQYNLQNIIKSNVFDTTALYEVFRYRIATNKYPSGLVDKRDTISALIGCLTNLNCQLNIGSKRLALYNKTFEDIEKLKQCSTDSEIDSILLNSTDQLSVFEKFIILESEVIFYGEVIAIQNDLPGARIFHSQYMIRVDSLIYSSSLINPGDSILLRKVTGIDNGIPQNQEEGAIKIWLFQDERLTLGQRKLFFLSNYSYLSRSLRSNILLNQNDEVCLKYYYDQLNLVRYSHLLEMKSKFVKDFVNKYQ